MASEDINGNPYKTSSATPTTAEDVNGLPYELKAGGAKLKVSVDSEKATPLDYFRHYIGRFIPGALSAGGAIAGGLATEGLGGEIAGAGAGSSIGQLLQSFSPRAFGQPPQSAGDVLTRTGEDIAGNAIVPAAGGEASKLLFPEGRINLLARFGQGLTPVKRAMAQDVEQQTISKVPYAAFPSEPQSDAAVLEIAAENARNMHKGLSGVVGKPESFEFTPSSQSLLNQNEVMRSFKYGSDPRTAPGAPFAKGTVGEKLVNTPYLTGSDGSPVVNTTKIRNLALSDVSQVRNFKVATGEPYTIEQLAMNDVLKSGYSSNTSTINPDNILKALDGDKKDVYNEALRPTTKQNLTDLMNTIKDAQETQKTNPAWSGTVNFLKHRLVFGGVMALAGGVSGHEGVALGAAGGIVLTDAAINKLMANPVTAKAVVAAIKTPSTSQVTPLLNRVIMNGLRGSYVMVNGPEDKLEKAYVDDKGQLTSDRPQGSP